MVIVEHSALAPEDQKNFMEGYRMELKNYFHEGISFALEKLDVVTRQEFDVQTELLSRTRHKLEILEQKLAGLEQRLMFNSPESHKK